MRKQPLALIGIAAFSTVILLAQTLPSTLPPPRLSKIIGLTAVPAKMPTRAFRINGTDYQSTLTAQREIRSGHDWQPSMPLPLSFENVEDIARRELHKFVSDDSVWHVTDFGVSRFPHSSEWYYAVTFKPRMQPRDLEEQSFTALLDFSGRPGLILADPKAQQ